MGALTHRINSFQMRPWELQSIFIYDVFNIGGQKIKIDLRDFQIIRILPSLLNDNNYWLTNYTRYIYLDLNYNKLDEILFLYKNSYISFDWHKTVEFLIFIFGRSLVGNIIKFLARVFRNIFVVLDVFDFGGLLWFLNKHISICDLKYIQKFSKSFLGEFSIFVKFSDLDFYGLSFDVYSTKASIQSANLCCGFDINYFGNKSLYDFFINNLKLLFESFSYFFVDILFFKEINFNLKSKLSLFLYVFCLCVIGKGYQKNIIMSWFFKFFFKEKNFLQIYDKYMSIISYNINYLAMKFFLSKFRNNKCKFKLYVNNILNNFVVNKNFNEIFIILSNFKLLCGDLCIPLKSVIESRNVLIALDGKLKKNSSVILNINKKIKLLKSVLNVIYVSSII